jgi:peptide/nickel transport system substrate-binding protein
MFLLVVGVAAATPAVGAAAKTDTLRVAVSTLPLQQANPFTSSLMPTITTTGAIFDSLTKYSRAGRVEPWLAVAWENVDTKTWRFKLRPNVSFSNGAPLTAAAVAATAEYFIARARPTENIVRELPRLAAARVVDPLTVEIVTAEPMPLFPRYATMFLVPDMKALDALGIEAFAKQPVGTGPYRLDRWAPGRASFSAFAGSWRAPKMPKLEIVALPETTARMQAVLSDQIDIATFLGPEEYEALKAAGHQAVAVADDTVNGIALVTNREGSPFKDVRVRRALNHAVNRPPMLEAIFAGLAKPANQPATRGEFGYNPDLPQYDYDPAKAKAMLAEAGYAEGFRFTMETTSISNVQLAYVQQVAADLAKIGVTMDIRPIAAPQYLKNLFMTGEYAEAFTMPWTGVPVGDILRGIEMHSCAHNVPWTCDPGIMPLIERIKNEWDEPTSEKLRRELMAYYHAEAPAIFVYESVTFAGVRKGVTGYEDMFGFIPFERIVIGP